MFWITAGLPSRAVSFVTTRALGRQIRPALPAGATITQLQGALAQCYLAVPSRSWTLTTPFSAERDALLERHEPLLGAVVPLADEQGER